jgi:hypothetical protein
MCAPTVVAAETAATECIYMYIHVCEELSLWCALLKIVIACLLDAFEESVNKADKAGKDATIVVTHK